MEKIEVRLGYDELDAVRELIEEYADALHVDLAFQHYEEELQDLTEKYALPLGRLYTIHVDGKAAGCLAFHPLTEKMCEFKRLYVRPAFRGRRLAWRLMGQALEDARKIGYQQVCLDTLASLKSAVALYEQLGFQQVSAYYENPLPGVRYYRRAL